MQVYGILSAQVGGILQSVFCKPNAYSMYSARRLLTVCVPHTVALQYVFRTLLPYVYKKHRLPFYGPLQNCENRLLAS
jgi:hypothetical protein